MDSSISPVLFGSVYHQLELLLHGVVIWLWFGIPLFQWASPKCVKPHESRLSLTQSLWQQLSGFLHYSPYLRPEICIIRKPGLSLFLSSQMHLLLRVYSPHNNLEITYLLHNLMWNKLCYCGYIPVLTRCQRFLFITIYFVLLRISFQSVFAIREVGIYIWVHL